MSNDTQIAEVAEIEEESTTVRRKGRPSYGEKAMKAGIYIRCSDDQKNAISEYVDGLNEQRASEGLPRIDVSSWIREIALKYSGNSDLGLAAQAAKMAKSFSV